jgi:hypothetical protein
MQMMKKYLIIIAMLFFFTGCEKLLIEKNSPSTPLDCFELMWKTLDEKYSYFTYKQIDWEQIYHEYKAKIHQDMSAYELFYVLADLLYELRDGHVNLTSGFDVSRNWDWYLDYPPNFNYNIIQRNYLGKEHKITGPLLNVVIDSIGYVYYGSFSRTISPSHIDQLIVNFRHTKGIIIDVRDNGGGSLVNANTFASRFFDKKRIVAKHVYKKGPQHDDFFEPVIETLSPDGPRQYHKPVVILANRKSYSATNDFILKMKSLPHVTLIGDKSGGGGGLPLNYELPNGWVFRFSGTMTLAPDGFNVEYGIPPDISINMEPQDEANGIDTILEFALDFLKNF